MEQFDVMRFALVAVRKRGQFKAIHATSGNKIDFILVRDDEWGRLQLSRRQSIGLAADLTAYAAHPEDVILGKLIYFKEGGSDRHLRDIAAMLHVSGEMIDQERLLHWADRLHVGDECRLVLSRVRSNSPS